MKFFATIGFLATLVSLFTFFALTNTAKSSSSGDATEVTFEKAVGDTPVPLPDSHGKDDDPFASDHTITDSDSNDRKSVHTGIQYLVNQQLANGGWNQGGGWRTASKGGRVEGVQVSDPADVGNTSIAALALIRAGSFPDSGKYKKNVKRALDFVINTIEDADDKSLYITDVRNTQLQSKIGTYVDTFLAVQLLSEVKGHMGDERSEKRLADALEKTLAKMEKHQMDNGQWGGAGWASVISQGIAVKGLNIARQKGMAVGDDVLKKAETFSKNKYDARSDKFGGASSSDAGIQLYSAGAGVGGLKDSVNTNRIKKKKYQSVLASPSAKPAEKRAAEKELEEIKRSEDDLDNQTAALATKLRDRKFVSGFGSNGGEEFWSLMNISETMALKGGKDWSNWNTYVTANIEKAQNGDGSWTGHHCITGKTFTTSTALLTLMADRAPRTTKDDVATTH